MGAWPHLPTIALPRRLRKPAYRETVPNIPSDAWQLAGAISDVSSKAGKRIAHMSHPGSSRASVPAYSGQDELNTFTLCRTVSPAVGIRANKRPRLPTLPTRTTQRCSCKRNGQVETVTVTLELPVSTSLSSYVRALEVVRDAQTDPKAKQAVAAVTALASRGLEETIARLRSLSGKAKPPPAHRSEQRASSPTVPMRRNPWRLDLAGDSGRTPRLSIRGQ